MCAKPEERTLDAELFGRDATFEYSETWVAYSLAVLRAVMAWVFLRAGLEKLFDPEWGAAGYLQFGVADANPLKGLFFFFLDYLWLVEPMIVYGQILVGLALFWTGAWQGGLTAGFPVEHGSFVDSSLVYLLLLFGLGAWGAGRVLGLDARLERTAPVRNNPSLRYLLG